MKVHCVNCKSQLPKSIIFRAKINCPICKSKLKVNPSNLTNSFILLSFVIGSMIGKMSDFSLSFAIICIMGLAIFSIVLQLISPPTVSIIEDLHIEPAKRLTDAEIKENIKNYNNEKAKFKVTKKWW